MIGDRLAEARRMRGMGQAELAAALGDRYDNSMISKVERGRSNLLVDGLARAAEELNVSADYLLGLTDDPSPSDKVPIPQFEGITEANQGNVTLSELESFPVSSTLLTKHEINPRRARFVEIREQYMYPSLPRGSLALVDLDRKWLKHNLVYLIIINHAVYAVRRLRGETREELQWHTDFYLDLKDAGWDFQDGHLVLQGSGRAHQEEAGAWPANSWRRELWLDEMRANMLLSRSAAEIAPFSHGNEVAVVGQVRGPLHIFDDEGW